MIPGSEPGAIDAHSHERVGSQTRGTLYVAVIEAPVERVLQSSRCTESVQRLLVQERNCGDESWIFTATDHPAAEASKDPQMNST